MFVTCGAAPIALGASNRLAFGLVDGAFRLLAFMLYLLLISQLKEMARVLGFHGAEHKAIHALEHRAPLTPESVQSFSRFHPRCGTSFLFLVVVVSIVVFTFIGKLRACAITCCGSRACADRGVAFEFIRIGQVLRPAAREGAGVAGLQFQRLTTREPDLDMCAIAIAALEKVRVDEAVVKLERAGNDARAEVAFVQ
jgi:uncharacterized protein YqhQ